MSESHPTRSIPPDVPPVDADATFTSADLRNTSGPPPGTATVPTIPGYEVLEEVGRGGMGVVYKARDEKLNRLVALKTVHAIDNADPRQLIRFLAEAEAAAAIRHPHVVAVYEFGEHAGRPFLVMEFCPGGTLGQRLRESGPLSPEGAARLVSRLAGAAAAAHELGIVHRDFKPSNVLFDPPRAPADATPPEAWGEPKVTDFGLAKRTGGADLTKTQAVMGTPAYMSPEQAEGRGKFVGPQADVYALGAILYECLTGTVPFEGETAMSVLHRVIHDDPVSPRVRKPGVARDIELICMKCLAKDPRDRYPTGKELADDLRRFAAGDPVSVRATGLPERAYRWARRNPSRAAAVGLGGLAAVLIGIGLVLFLALREAAEARQKAEEANTSLTDAMDTVEKALAGETAARGELAGALDAERALKGKLETALGGERAAKAELEATQLELVRQGYFRSVDLAHRAGFEGNRGRAAALLDSCPAGLRGWEWHHAHARLHAALLTLGGPDAILEGTALTSLEAGNSLAASPSGPWVALHRRGTLHVWDTRTGAEVLRTAEVGGSLDFGTDGRLWCSGRAVPPSSLDIPVGALRQAKSSERDMNWTGPVSPCGRYAIALRRLTSIVVTDNETGTPLFTITPEKPEFFLNPPAAFSPDGERVAVAVNRRVEVWGVRTGQRLLVLVVPGQAEHNASFIRFNRDGDVVVTAGADGTVRAWDLNTGLVKFSTSVARGRGGSAAFSPSGDLVAACGELGLVVTATAPGREVWTAPPDQPFEGVAFSPDGSRLAVWGAQVVQVYAADTGYLLRELTGHEGRVKQAVFTADGRVVSLDDAGFVRIWDDHAPEAFIHLGVMGAGVTAIDPTGNLFALAGQVLLDPKKMLQRGVVVWDLTTRKAVARFPTTVENPIWAAFTADGRHLLLGTEFGRVSSWELATGKRSANRYWVVSGRMTATHTGRNLLAVYDEDAKRVTVWDVGKVPERLVTDARRFNPEDAPRVLPPEQCPVRVGEFEVPGPKPALLFSPDGGHLLALPPGHPGKAWELGTGRVTDTAAFTVGVFSTVVPFAATRRPAAVGPGGTRVVWAFRGELKVSDARTGFDALALARRGSDLKAPAFSPDGTKLYALVPGGVMVFDSAPRPPFVPHTFEPAPLPRPIMRP